MDLGQRLKQARLEKGLSQRQLCGDTITRNMLSLIENGSAKPSMDTLRYLAGRLEKPMSYFLEEAAPSPNQALILQARTAAPAQVLALLKDYKEPDILLDPERWLLTALSCLALAEQAIEENRLPLANSYLEQAAQAAAQTPYCTPQLELRRILLCRRAGGNAAALAAALPDNSQELLLRAEAALEIGDAARCAALLDAAEGRDARWHFLMGEACFCLEQYAAAAEQYLLAEDAFPKAVYPRLEECYRLLEDYKQAYEYACKQRP